MALNNDLNTIVQKFSEHYHDAWASRKIENSWVYGDQWSDANKSHPRLKPYAMLNDYVSKYPEIVSSNRINFTKKFEYFRKKNDIKNQYENR